MAAEGSAEWKGDVPSGSGTFTAGDTISGEFSFKSRFEDGPGANPEQLIAAAHASKHPWPAEHHRSPASASTADAAGFGQPHG